VLLRCHISLKQVADLDGFDYGTVSLDKSIKVRYAHFDDFAAFLTLSNNVTEYSPISAITKQAIDKYRTKIECNQTDCPIALQWKTATAKTKKEI
jgi:hypothetical protein